MSAAVVALGAFVLVAWTGFLPVALAAVLLASVALFDALALARQPRVEVSVTGPSIVHLRHRFELEVSGVETTRAWVAAPLQLGGT
ncbi:MAG: hypothetical protein AAFY60_15205, partial [Myxococcota bacterium]